MKIADFIAKKTEDKRVDVGEAKEIEKEARAKGVAAGDPVKITEGAKKALDELLKSQDVFFEPQAKEALMALAAAPVVVKPPDPTKRSELFKTDGPPLQLKLTSDFVSLFANKQGTGRNPGMAGSLEFGEGAAKKTIPVNIRTRGQSSLSSLPEPKLKIKLDSAARAGTPFEKEGSLEIGVQGGASGKDSLGRVLIPEAPSREAATYALLEEMGLAVPRTRVANFDYVDAQGKVRSQPAFLTEDADSVATRFLGERGVEVGNYGNADQQPNLRATLQTKDLIRLNLAQVMIGNRDWAFSASGDMTQPTVTTTVSMHNTKMIFRPSTDPVNAGSQGDAMPVATDFDLSHFVLQKEYAGYMKNQWQPIDYPKDLKTLRATFPGAQFDDLLKDVVGRKEKMLARLEQYPVDAESKAFIKDALEKFFAATQAEITPAQPVVVPAPVVPAPVVADPVIAAPIVPDPVVPHPPPPPPPVVVDPVVAAVPKQVVDLWTQYFPNEGVPKGQAMLRALTVTADVQKLVSADPKVLNSNGIRTKLMTLEALLDLYRKDFPALSGPAAQIKQLEDAIGAANKPQSPEQQAAAEARLASMAKTSWVGADGKSPAIQNALTALKSAGLGSDDADRKLMKAGVVAKVRQIGTTAFNMKDLQGPNGIHDLRKEVRWVKYYLDLAAVAGGPTNLLPAELVQTFNAANTTLSDIKDRGEEANALAEKLSREGGVNPQEARKRAAAQLGPAYEESKMFEEAAASYDTVKSVFAKYNAALDN